MTNMQLDFAFLQRQKNAGVAKMNLCLS